MPTQTLQTEIPLPARRRFNWDLRPGAFERREWQYYFGYWESGSLERTIGCCQLLLGRPKNRRDVRVSRYL